jgi:23S rRNA (adenine2503-C2)-methyltransferase
MKSFFGLNRTEFTEEIAKNFGMQKANLRAGNFFRKIYKQKPLNLREFEGLSNELKQWFLEQFDLTLPLEISDVHYSSHDGSIKFALSLKSDGRFIESVLIPERGRLTQCISTQVGCAQGCRFCQTGRMGMIRNLTTEEIVAQVLVADLWRQNNRTSQVSSYLQISNIVYMGMGEPLDNIDTVINSTKIFCDNLGLNFSPNKVTISTVGLLPALTQVLESTKVAIALSLHSPFDAERSKIMPVNLKCPIAEVIETIRKFAKSGARKSFMIQYTLLRGINDSMEHATALVSLLKDVPVKINLIPLNEHEGASFRRPDIGRVYAFQQELKKAGMIATVRLSKGRDIQAACGQLIKNRVSKE